MGDHEGVFTLATPPGARRNCTLATLLFPGNFQILESTMAGVRSGEEGPDAPVSARQTQKAKVAPNFLEEESRGPHASLCLSETE